MRSIKKSIFIASTIISTNSYSAFGIDGNTPILMSILTNTGEQLVRMEKILSKAEDQVKYTAEIQKATESLKEKYNTLTELEDTFNTLAEISSNSPEDLRDINDKLEELKSKKEQIAELMQKSKEIERKSMVETRKEERFSLQLSSLKKEDDMQMKKSRDYATKNQGQVTSQNTALLNKKMTVQLQQLSGINEKLAESNLLQSKELQLKQKDEIELNSFMNDNVKKR